MKLRLNNGVEIPDIGMGTYPLTGSTLKSAVFAACESGCRLFDTADNYYNESDLGASLIDVYHRLGLSRTDLFLVSKISDELYKIGEIGAGTNKGIYFWRNSPTMQTENALKRIINQKIENTLKSLCTDYLDLWLMHWPYPDYFEEIWMEMMKMYKVGKVRAIGVCNCRQRHIEKLKSAFDIIPMVNQFESSPLNTKEDLVNYCHENEIQVMVYSPLQSLKHSRIYKDLFAYIDALCTKYNKNRAQILLRFDIERGLIPIPKSKSSERIMGNYDIFNFCLDTDEVTKLMSYNVNLQYLPESKCCPGL